MQEIKLDTFSWFISPLGTNSLGTASRTENGWRGICLSSILVRSSDFSLLPPIITCQQQFCWWCHQLILHNYCGVKMRSAMYKGTLPTKNLISPLTIVREYNHSIIKRDQTLCNNNLTSDQWAIGTSHTHSTAQHSTKRVDPYQTEHCSMYNVVHCHPCWDKNHC